MDSFKFESGRSIEPFVAELFWEPQNTIGKAEALSRMEEKVQYLRDLQPESGAYVNEVYINEPDWQHTFWGDNYENLLAIKKDRDPTEVFWCHPCVRNEGWEAIGDQLCTI